MYLVKFQAVEKEQWSPLGCSGYIIEEYVETEDPGYARLRAYQEMQKELEEDIKDYKISFMSIKKIKSIK